jgi:hypothetical protein
MPEIASKARIGWKIPVLPKKDNLEGCGATGGASYGGYPSGLDNRQIIDLRQR